MTINPAKFGKDVIDQFGRYLKNTFPISNEDIAIQLNEKLKHSSDSLIAKGPYIYLNKPFVEGKSLDELSKELNLHPALKNIFPFEKLHIHQEKAIKAIKKNKNLIVSTGTGSGKTESFLLPIIDECLKANESRVESGVLAIIVYPMNALVNDQLERLRLMLAGTNITFGRYTGETPTNSSNINKLEISRVYTKEELEGYFEHHQELPLPFEECYSRDEITQRKPRILLTNYSQLEYLLLRDKDLDLFRNDTLKFLVLDEVHTYTGELGSEMACLIRRIKGLIDHDILSIATSATVADENGKEYIKTFASNLFGEDANSFEVVEEEYKENKPQKNLYKPNLPDNIFDILEKILEKVHKLYLAEDVLDIDDELLNLAKELCGVGFDFKTELNIEKLGELLIHNSYIHILEEEFSSPKLIKDVFNRLKSIANRKKASIKELEAEIFAYLILGAIARYDNEPVLRPKLHHFVKGLYGIYATIEDRVRLHFEEKNDKYFHHNFKICRNCGQHFFGIVTEKLPINENGVGVYTILRHLKDYESIDEQSEKGWFLTNDLLMLDEESNEGEFVYVCKHCGAIHVKEVDTCHNPKCKNSDKPVKMHSYKSDIKKCPSCSVSIKKGSLPVITEIRSVEVLDVMILAQSMLTAMPERELQKLIIFADSRQDAAFQAGWMNARSKRFHLRYLNYLIVKNFKNKLDEALSYDNMVERLMEEAINHKVYEAKGFKVDELNKRIRWYLIEEYFGVTRRYSLEKLGLVKIVYDIPKDSQFLTIWAQELKVDERDIYNTIVLILDYLRNTGAVNDDLAKRSWSYTDIEVRKGIVNYIENKRPGAFVLEKRDDLKKYNFIKSFRSSNGRSAVEVITKKCLGTGKNIKDFIYDLWDFLLEHEIIKESKLIYKYHGSIRPLLRNTTQKTYQVNKNIIGFKLVDEIYRCRSCKQVFSVVSKTKKCPNYYCKGVLEKASVDSENYDIIQYTKMNYTPIKAAEHSAQVPKEQRELYEKEFKKPNGEVNCLVATPTLEMGVDIGKLEMVLMRNIPPSTPNYTQRAGRAGRRHRIATVFSYARNAPHDSYFFNNPAELIAGNIKVPTFSMRNQPLVKKHIHSSVLTYLRMHGDSEDFEVLKKTFPTYIKEYLTYIDDLGKRKFRDRVDKFKDFQKLIDKHFDNLFYFVKNIILKSWPNSEEDFINEEFIKDSISNMPKALYEHILNLYLEVKTYKNLLDELKRLDILEMDKEKEKEFRSLKYAFDSYLRETQDNYTLSFLSTDGFFPSYAMGRESVKAQCSEPFIEISRSKAVAIRELTPANKLYADKTIFDVERLNFYKFREKDKNFTPNLIRKQLVFNSNSGAIIEFNDIERVGGDREYKYFGSFEMTDVILKESQKIDDIKESRVRVGFRLAGMLQNFHKGGKNYLLNDLNIKYYIQGKVRIINTGLAGQDIIGFPICPRCGAVRNPRASEAEINDFLKAHIQSCKVLDADEFFSALHTDIQSDLVIIGDFEDKTDAVNFMEALKIGASMVLDMQDGDIDAVIETKDNGKFQIIFYDPLPGGSGFLPLILDMYSKILESSIKKLKDCDCEESCYKCLLSFTNQQFHSILNRFVATDILDSYKSAPKFQNEIPPLIIQKEKEKEKTDSTAEEKFLDYLKEQNFPLPKPQFRVDLNGREFTVADFAYPDKKILIYIDGLSEAIHGNTAQQIKDKLLRAKARLKGYHIVEISAQGIDDHEIMGRVLETITIYLKINI